MTLAWDDFRNDTAALRSGGTAPAFAQVLNNGGSVGVFAQRFSVGDDIHFGMQFPHSWAQGTSIRPHIHWCPSIDIPIGQTVTFVFEYAWWNILAARPAVTTIDVTASYISAALTPAGTHLMSACASIPGTGQNISSIMLCRVGRGAGTFNNGSTVFILSFDIHLQYDAQGSLNESSKP